MRMQQYQQQQQQQARLAQQQQQQQLQQSQQQFVQSLNNAAPPSPAAVATPTGGGVAKQPHIPEKAVAKQPNAENVENAPLLSTPDVAKAKVENKPRGRGGISFMQVRCC
jgi:type II secretory pathway pseudopilin PulG